MPTQGHSEADAGVPIPVQRERGRQVAPAPRFYETLLTALSELGEGVVVLEGETFVYVNPAFARMVGHTPEELTRPGFSVRLLFHPEARASMEEHLRRRLAGEATEDHYTGILQKPDGQRVYVDISVKPLRHDGRALRFAVLRDTTSRHLVEEQLSAARREAQQIEKLAALGSLVSGVAHEVRTPLVYIQNHAHVLRSRVARIAAGEEDPRQALAEMDAAIASIEEGIDRVNRLVKDLHRFARLPGGDRRGERLDEVVAEAVRLWEATHVGRDVHVRAQLEPTPSVPLDRARIQQVVLNLIQNAADAMSRGGVIAVATEALPHGARLRVADHGPGIAPEAIGHIFEPFFTTKSDGMGLGLHIVRRIVEAHHGTIACESVPGQGTTFVVTLPALAGGAPP